MLHSLITLEVLRTICSARDQSGWGTWKASALISELYLRFYTSFKAIWGEKREGSSIYHRHIDEAVFLWSPFFFLQRISPMQHLHNNKDMISRNRCMETATAMADIHKDPTSADIKTLKLFVRPSKCWVELMNRWGGAGNRTTNHKRWKVFKNCVVVTKPWLEM